MITTAKRGSTSRKRPMVRVSDGTHATLKELAERSGEPIHVVVEKAVEAYRRERFFVELDEAYAALQNDPEAWSEELAERAAWEITLADGLEGD
jgi:predicted transcriptional regulator